MAQSGYKSAASALFSYFLRVETSVQIQSIHPGSEREFAKLQSDGIFFFFLHFSSSGEILATSGIDEARVGASELPKGSAERHGQLI